MAAGDGVHALVLAAGAGRRFGGGKLLAAYRGEPLLLGAVRAALASGVETATVVLGCDAEAVATALAGVTDARLRRVVAADWADGLSASLRAGVLSLPAEARGCLIFLGDMPEAGPAAAAAVLAALRRGAAAAMPTHDGKPGHPVGFARAEFPALTALTGDRGAGPLLDRLGLRVARIALSDPGVIFDVDRPADLGGRG